MSDLPLARYNKSQIAEAAAKLNLNADSCVGLWEALQTDGTFAINGYNMGAYDYPAMFAEAFGLRVEGVIIGAMTMSLMSTFFIFMIGLVPLHGSADTRAWIPLSPEEMLGINEQYESCGPAFYGDKPLGGPLK